MQTELYILHFNYFHLLILLFVPLFMLGVIFLITNQTAKKNGTKIIKEIIKNPIALVIGIILSIILIYFTSKYIITYFNAKKSLETNDCQTVEGYVEDFIPGETQQNDESFKINGIYFEYSDSSVSIINGYQKFSSRGGVITHNNQHLLIKYYTNKNNYKIIVYIAEINDSN